MEENKKIWQSKTNWVALIVAISAFIPSVSNWIGQNPTAFAEIVAGLMMVLRMISKGKIDIK
jgi:hypothetical protein